MHRSVQFTVELLKRTSINDTKHRLSVAVVFYRQRQESTNTDSYSSHDAMPSQCACACYDLRTLCFAYLSVIPTHECGVVLFSVASVCVSVSILFGSLTLKALT